MPTDHSPVRPEIAEVSCGGEFDPFCRCPDGRFDGKMGMSDFRWESPVLSVKMYLC